VRPVPLPQDDPAERRPRRHRPDDRRQIGEPDLLLRRRLPLRAGPGRRHLPLSRAHALQGDRAPPRPDADLAGDRGGRRRPQRGHRPRIDHLLVQDPEHPLRLRLRRPRRHPAQLRDRYRRARQGALGDHRGDPLHPGLAGGRRPRGDRRGRLGRGGGRPLHRRLGADGRCRRPRGDGRLLAPQLRPGPARRRRRRRGPPRGGCGPHRGALRRPRQARAAGRVRADRGRPGRRPRPPRRAGDGAGPPLPLDAGPALLDRAPLRAVDDRGRALLRHELPPLPGDPGEARPRLFRLRLLPPLRRRRPGRRLRRHRPGAGRGDGRRHRRGAAQAGPRAGPRGRAPPDQGAPQGPPPDGPRGQPLRGLLDRQPGGDLRRDQNPRAGDGEDRGRHRRGGPGARRRALPGGEAQPRPRRPLQRSPALRRPPQDRM
ncbi:MAG: FIG007959: peptidase, M16 family, partial [uncultured Thermomicrobiales bacterium]